MNMVEWKKIGEICDVGTGSNNREDACDNGLYPFYVRSKDVLRIDSYLYDEEAILIPGEGGVGDIFHYVNGKYGLHQRTYRVHPISTKVSGRYIFYYLSGNFKSYINSKSYKATAASIRKPMLLDFPIALPAVKVQQRIVGILDTFTSSIENLKQQIAQRRKQYEYYRDQLLDLEGKEGVEMKTLEEVCIIKNGYTPSTKNSEFWDGGSLPWFTLEDIRKNGRILDDAIKHITHLGVKKGGLFPAKSIIISTTATIGEYALIQTDFLCNQQISCLSIKDKDIVLPKFLYYLAPHIGEWCKKNVNGGGSLLIVSTSKLQIVRIPVPSLSEQQRIVDILDTFEASIQNLEDQLSQREKQYECYRNKLLTFE